MEKVLLVKSTHWGVTGIWGPARLAAGRRPTPRPAQPEGTVAVESSPSPQLLTQSFLLEALTCWELGRPRRALC